MRTSLFRTDPGPEPKTPFAADSFDTRTIRNMIIPIGIGKKLNRPKRLLATHQCIVN
jgi:hypothetical protein